MVLTGAGCTGASCLKLPKAVKPLATPEAKKAVDDPSCTYPDGEHKGATIDLCMIDPGGGCEGYEVGCVYVDYEQGCVFVLCRKECESPWEEKFHECVQAPTPEKSFQQRYEEHGL